MKMMATHHRFLWVMEGININHKMVFSHEFSIRGSWIRAINMIIIMYMIFMHIKMKYDKIRASGKIKLKTQK